MTPSHQISYTRGYRGSMHRITRLPLSSRDTHITPVVPARRDIRIGVAHAIADLNPIPGAVGELGHNSGVKAGWILALEARYAARIVRPVDTRTGAAVTPIEPARGPALRSIAAAVTLPLLHAGCVSGGGGRCLVAAGVQTVEHAVCARVIGAVNARAWAAVTSIVPTRRHVQRYIALAVADVGDRAGGTAVVLSSNTLEEAPKDDGSGKAGLPRHGRLPVFFRRRDLRPRRPFTTPCGREAKNRVDMSETARCCLDVCIYGVQRSGEGKRSGFRQFHLTVSLVSLPKPGTEHLGVCCDWDAIKESAQSSERQRQRNHTKRPVSVPRSLLRSQKTSSRNCMYDGWLCEEHRWARSPCP